MRPFLVVPMLVLGLVAIATPSSAFICNLPEWATPAQPPHPLVHPAGIGEPSANPIRETYHDTREGLILTFHVLCSIPPMDSPVAVAASPYNS